MKALWKEDWYFFKWPNLFEEMSHYLLWKNFQQDVGQGAYYTAVEQQTIIITCLAIYI